MKKILSLFTAALFIAALLVNFSSDSNGHLRFFKQANASAPLYQPTSVPCIIDGYAYAWAIVCAEGTQTSCTALGCPNPPPQD